jgi:hypothetical protein
LPGRLEIRVDDFLGIGAEDESQALGMRNWDEDEVQEGVVTRFS